MPPKHATQEQLVKTKMCNRGDACRWRYCTFAHSEDELRCFAFAVTGFCNRHRSGTCPLQHTASPGLTVSRPAPLDIAEAEADATEAQLDPRKYYSHSTRWKSHGAKPRDGVPRYVRRLRELPIPPGLRRNIAKSKAEARSKLIIPRSLMHALQSDDAETLLTTQLIIERSQCDHDIRYFDLEPAEMVPFSSDRAPPPRGYAFFKITCLGLAEKRPSVLRGDAVHVFDLTFEEWHVGYVYWVNLDNLIVCMDAQLALYRFPNVVFSVPQSVFNKMYTAVKTAADFRPRMQWALTGIDGLGAELTPSLPYVNRLQRQFIVEVCQHAKLLHLLHGPPGTGKTTTLVHLMSALRKNRGIRIMVMTPSNQSADLIVQRLARLCPDLQPGELLRVMALSRDWRDIPEDVRRCLPPGTISVDDVQRAKVVVSTLMTASVIFGIVPKNHAAGDFTHYIIDEAAQATEQELLVGLQFLAENQSSSLVLAGDHKQLGPIIRNAACKASGMGRSALERLCIDEEAPHTMLAENYRAHPLLVELINPTYGNQLVATRSNTSLVFDAPLLFVHVDGRETQEADSPSWMNLEEKDEVLAQINAVRQRGVRPKDIVVLAPYQKQVQKIRGSIHFVVTSRGDRELADVQVCSVELYQGREARVVILSCVRSRRHDHIQADVRFNIGFLRNPQRLNVALSRAQDLLIIVGNSKVLESADAEWKRIVDVCRNQGLLAGCPPSPPPSPPAPSAPLGPSANRTAARGAGGGRGRGVGRGGHGGSPSDDSSSDGGDHGHNVDAAWGDYR